MLRLIVLVFVSLSLFAQSSTPAKSKVGRKAISAELCAEYWHADSELKVAVAGMQAKQSAAQQVAQKLQAACPDGNLTTPNPEEPQHGIWCSPKPEPEPEKNVTPPKSEAKK